MLRPVSPDDELLDVPATVPDDLPITHGNLLDFPEDPLGCMTRLQRRHGPVALLTDGEQQLAFVFSPEYNQQVLSDGQTFHSRFFAVRGPKRSPQRRLTAGLLSMNGEEHKQHRRTVMAPFQKRILGAYHETICRLAGEMLDTWRPGEVRDLHVEMTHFMLRLTSAILFGLDVPEMAYRLGGMIDEWVHMNHRTGMGAFVSDPRFVSRYDELLELAGRLETGLQELIDLRRREGSSGSDVLSLLLQAHDAEGQVDDQQLVGHLALLFGAAHLTTAHTFTWTLFLLAQHPSILREVHAEMQAGLADLVPSPDEVAALPLLERVVKESMRILPASAYSQRINVEPVALGPLRLRPATAVVFSQFVTHHLPELYPEPESFRPERWESISPSPYAYLPFGAGPRMCIGAPLATMILKTVLPMVVQRYRLTLVPGCQVGAKVVSTMLSPSTSVPMIVSRQDGRFESSPVEGDIHRLVDLRETPRARRRAA